MDAATAQAFPAITRARAPRTGAAAYGELLKPITWFAPMWAFGCGVVSSGAPLGGRGGRFMR